MRSAPLIPLTLLLFLTLSCTLGDQDDYSGLWLQTGITPYEEQGPLEICMANHRIAPPGSRLGGFCRKRDSERPVRCTSHKECRGRETCVCGECTVKYCTRTDECEEGSVCDFNAKRCVISCSSDCDCPGTNPRCDLGMCQQMCIVDSECQTGELCALSIARCVTAPCSIDSDCYPDEECAIQMEPRLVQEPSLVKDEGWTYSLFVEMDQGSLDRRVIFRAQSYDGETWSMVPPAPVLESDAGDDWRVGAPSVVYQANKYIMFFVVGEGRAIGRATSTNGRDWIRDANPVVVPQGDEGAVDAPSAVVTPDGASILLYFEVGRGREIKRLQSLDRVGFQWPDPATSPESRVRVVQPQDLDDGILWRGVSRVHSPHVTLERDRDGEWIYKMLVSAHGYESAEASSFGTTDQVRANLSIGYLASRDGVHFSPFPFNPVFDRIVPNSFVNHASELSPATLDLGGKTLLFYGIADVDEMVWSNLGYAVNPPRHNFPDTLR